MSLKSTHIVGNLNLDPHCGFDNQTDWEECNFVRTWKNVHFGLTLTFDVVTLFILLFLRNHKSFIQRIFLNILISNIGEAIFTLMNNGSKEVLCVIAGFGVQYFGLVLFMWVCSLTVYVSLILLKNIDSKHYERRYRTVCWGLPLILALIPLVPLPDGRPADLVVHHKDYGIHYGPAGAFCWIVDGQVGDPLRFAIWWIPVMSCVVIIFIMCVYLMIKGSRGSFAVGYDRSHREHRRLMRKYLRPMAGYGASFTVIHTFMIADRIHTSIYDHPSFVTRMMHIIGFCGYGMVLCTLYFFLSGRKEFTVNKWRSAWRYHRKRLMCKKIADIIEVSVVPHIRPTLSLSSYEQQSSKDDDTHTPVGGQVNVAVISDLADMGPSKPSRKIQRVCQPDPSLCEESHYRYSHSGLELSVANYPVQCEDDLSSSI